LTKDLDKKTLLKKAAEKDLETFIKLVTNDRRVLGSVHTEIIHWWNRSDAMTHQLLLLPRDHQKSALVAYRVAWEITRNPKVRVLYISSTSNLASKQLKFIKDILTCDIYRRYWPEMINLEESKREKWTESEISIDHPLRKLEAVRDPTVFTAGLTTSITGLHCDIAVMDDVVVHENAYTIDGRDRTKTQYSLLASIAGTNSKAWVVGTRYHPKDLYHDMREMRIDQYNDTGEIIDRIPLYEVFERQVEDIGDGTGQFLWPRQQRFDGEWFGFSRDILAQKRAQYLDRVQFRAQYYNDPNDPEGAGIKRDNFQYYEKQFVKRIEGKWQINGRRINILAAVDFAFSLKKEADYSAIVVIGIDADSQIYVLDIDRFKTSDNAEYFRRILALHQKWDFRKIIAETTAAQEIIVNTLKQTYIAQHGLALSIEPFKPHRHLGSKEERIEAVLQPRYREMQIWHYRGGYCSILEEELVLQNPAHDDLKDAMATAVQHIIRPMQMNVHRHRERYADMAHTRFGGLG